ncbi:T9SS type A sorting domain-containing protein [Hymenobacter cellulosilyticus]|uniref:T9SS type A sorting domain-containing protein n=1 Tax=Hymenobacter cellulosilyticus TaxID=2932248 RepID=A0A8T9Q3J1_9BACT|nr:T9SS type A sorting domain-containing protein [Hymenobacter cellulosilyticus]UOQ72306.1 T9SS type A sorting domain-containing protein [Hymenobacter cellulosilyticus]
MRPGATSFLRWQWSGPAATVGQLEYQPLGSSKWRVLQAGIPLAQSNYAWPVPDTTTLARVRMVAGSGTFVSDTFTVARPLTPTVGYACQDEALIQWEQVPGASRYQVYQLVQNYLEPYVITTDTALVLNKAQMQIRYYAVAPIMGKLLGERGNTIEFTEQGTACYVKSFIPRSVVTDTVLFDLEIGTTFGVKSISLERLTAAGPTVVQTISPVTARQLSFLDNNPAPGRNEYRVRLDLAKGGVVYSDTEQVQFARPREVQAFPNPIVAGEQLQILVAESGPAKIQLYDMTGHLVRESTDTGTIRTLSTVGIAKGLYLLRVQTGDRTTMTTRVVVL